MKRASIVVVLCGCLSLSMFGVAGATAISKKGAAKQYLALVAPVNAAAGKLIKQINGWTDSTTHAKAETDAKPVIAVALKFDNELTTDSWPASAKSDVKALNKAVAPLVADLRALKSDNLQNPSVLTTFERGLNALGAAATAVRYDLGLPSTPATTPTSPAISSSMLGTADPKIPPLVPGKVAILESGPLVRTLVIGSEGATVTVMVGNGTSGPISHLVVSATAVASTGKTVGTGGTVGFTPTNVAPGHVSFSYVQFLDPVPAGAKIQLIVTSYNSGPTPTEVDVPVTQAQSTSGHIVGSITNNGTTPVYPQDPQAFCFDAKGAMRGVSTGGTFNLPASRELMPGASASFNIPVYEPPCPTILLGASGETPL
jgi:hypothetical protein